MMGDGQPNWKYRDFYDRQLAFIAANDVDGLIHNQYTDDAELLNFNVHIKGTAALIEYFKGYLASLGYIKLLSTDQYTESDDSMFFESTVETAGGIARVYDIFVMRDGKIWRHYPGLLGFTPNATAAS
jgi:hypothetical protein